MSCPIPRRAARDAARDPGGRRGWTTVWLAQAWKRARAGTPCARSVQPMRFSSTTGMVRLVRVWYSLKAGRTSATLS